MGLYNGCRDGELVGKSKEAFDLSKEDRGVLKRYDTSGLFRNKDVQRYGDMRHSPLVLDRTGTIEGLGRY